MGLADLIEQYCDQEQIATFQCQTGVKNFEKILKVLGYSDVNEFLEDNSGAIEAMFNWIGRQRNKEWIAAFKEEVQEEEE